MMQSLTVDKVMEQELSQLAEHQGKSIQQLLKDILLEYIEDAHDAALGDAAMQELENGEDFTIPFSEVKRQMNELDN
jgi:predicted DNA-binding protein